MGAKLSSPNGELPRERTYLITGANVGIGYVTAKRIAQLGGRVIITCRSEEKAKNTIERMKIDHQEELTNNDGNQLGPAVTTLNLQYMTLELNSLRSVEEFAAKYKESGLPLHVLICNAGAVFPRREYTDDGFESHFQVNYLSHLLLTLHLLPLIKAAGPDSRIVNVSSSAHTLADLAFDNLQSEKSFSARKKYANSKIAQIMNMYVLAEKLKDDNVSVFSVHPGVVQTNITHQMNRSSRLLVGTVSRLGLMRDPEKGAMTTLVAALDPVYNGMTGLYLADCKIKTTTSLSRNETKQLRLWRYSLACLKPYLNNTILREVHEDVNDITEVNHRVEAFVTSSPDQREERSEASLQNKLKDSTDSQAKSSNEEQDTQRSLGEGERDEEDLRQEDHSVEKANEEEGSSRKDGEDPNSESILVHPHENGKLPARAEEAADEGEDEKRDESLEDDQAPGSSDLKLNAGSVGSNATPDGEKKEKKVEGTADEERSEMDRKEGGMDADDLEVTHVGNEDEFPDDDEETSEGRETSEGNGSRMTKSTPTSKSEDNHEDGSSEEKNREVDHTIGTAYGKDVAKSGYTQEGGATVDI